MQTLSIISFVTNKLDELTEVLRKILESQSNRTKIENTIDKINNDIEKINKQIRMLYQDKLNNIIEEQDYIFFSENLEKKN